MSDTRDISDIRDRLSCAGYEDSMLIDGYDDAIIGVTMDGAVVYDYYLMVAIMVERDGITSDEAAEYIDYNVIRACPYYDPSPIVIFDIESL